MLALTHLAWVVVVVSSEEVMEADFAEDIAEEVAECHARHATNAEDRIISLATVKLKQRNAMLAVNWGTFQANAMLRMEGR